MTVTILTEPAEQH